MSTEELKAIARHHYENINDLEAAFALISPDVTFHMAGRPPTYQDWKQGHAPFIAAFPDMALTIEDQLAEGDTVVTRWTMRGTHQGDLMGMPPTGQPVTVGGISIDRIAGGQVVEHWVQLDLLGMMQQLGAIPTPEA